jgi:hypothetical protein
MADYERQAQSMLRSDLREDHAAGSHTGAANRYCGDCNPGPKEPIDYSWNPPKKNTSHLFNDRRSSKGNGTQGQPGLTSL